MAIGATQKWYAGAAVASVFVLGAGWFGLIAPQKASASDIAAQTTTVNATNATTERQIAALKQQFQMLPEVQAQVAVIRTRIPQTPNEPTLIRTLTAAAKSSGVTVSSTNFVTPQIMTGTTAAAPAAGSNTFAVPGQMSQIGVSIAIKGSFAQTKLFLSKLEGMQRVMMVTGLQITSGGKDPKSGVNQVTTTVTARTFMANPGTLTAAATTKPGATGTAATSTSSTTSPS
jgi:Tfp pilus assembly protein PilO